METSSGIQASLAGRYASALFGLARDERQIEAVSRSLELLAQALVDSREFGELVSSPLIDRDQAGKAFAAVGQQLSLASAQAMLSSRRRRACWRAEPGRSS